MDLRVKIAAFVTEGHSYRSAAERFGVSDTFVAKLIKTWRDTGQLEPGRQGREKSGRLVALHGFLIETVEERPYISMPALAKRVYDAHGVIISASALSQCLIALGFTFQPGIRARGVRGRFRLGRAGAVTEAA